MLTTVDIRTQMAMTLVVPSKSIKISRYAVVELTRFILETSRTQAIIQCDDEQTIKAIVKDVITDLGGLTVRTAPVKSSQSQGSF